MHLIDVVVLASEFIMDEKIQNEHGEQTKKFF